MKKRWIYLLTAVLCTIGVYAGKPVVSKAVPLEADAGGFVDGDCSLTVYPEDPGKEEADRFGEDLAEADVVIDLYQVARAVKVPGSDTYRYQILPGYGLTIPDYPADGDWAAFAQEAAVDALEKDATHTLVKSGIATGAATDVEAGLYLIIARGSDLTKVEDYKIEVTQKDEAMGEDITRLATIANSHKNTYLFAPQLVSLPTKEADSDGVINTANPGEWVYDLVVNLKPEQAARFGSLEIVKTLSEYEAEEGVPESVTCVFEVTGRLGGEQVYSEVESITFTAAGQERVVLDQIPAMAEVTVREVYSGAGYQLTTPGDRQATIAADAVVSVDFENVYDGRRVHGHGIKNQFVQDESGAWHWYSDPAQDGAGNEGTPPTHGPSQP